MKNILLLLHDDAGQEARLQVALDLTRALSGHLRCLSASEVPVFVDGFGGASTGILIQDEVDAAARNRVRIEQRLAAEGVSWECQDAVGDLSQTISDAASTADLVVLNRRLEHGPFPDMRHIVGEVLTNTRALAVAVDESCRSFDAAGKVLIGWDGSETIMATVRRAVPLLSLATDVKIFQVGELGDSAIPITEAATYLSRHGINAEIEVAPSADSIAAAFRLEAERYGAAYCLMGAFTHSRIREALFGGVTRAMLSASSIPMVLGH